MLTTPTTATADRPIAYSYRRVSSTKQLGGDGMGRQLKAAAEWCEANGYILSTDDLDDGGKSAFKGDNTATGKLGLFLEAVRAGRVPVGATLLVENLDRLSRQRHLEARNLLEGILLSGIDVVTLQDRKRYTSKDLHEDPMTSIMIILNFARAHEESATKSKRLKAKWQSNTQAVLEGTRIRTSQCPGWLEVVGGLHTGQYKVLPAPAKVIAEVFSRFANGEGPSAIARDLQARGVPTMRRGNWRPQTISQLLRSEAPYGHLEIGRQLTEAERDGTDPLPKGTYRKGDRVIIDMARNVLPRVVDAETERRVRFLLDNREAEVKPTAPVKQPTHKTKAMLTGVLKGELGENLKRKAYARTAAYVSPVSNAYVAAVSHIDEVLVDYWPEVRKAAMVETNPQTEGLEAQLTEAQETLTFLQSRPSTAPRLLLAAEAEVEELTAEIKRMTEAAGMGAIDLPRDISGMEPHEVNLLVRRVILEVTAIKSALTKTETQTIKRPDGGTFERRVKRPTYDLRVTMRNGLVLTLGQGASGLGRNGE